MIKKVAKEELQSLLHLVLALWPDNDPAEMGEELAQALENPEASYFLAVEAGEAVGFAQCQLRRDYVEGTESSPVGYLEGIYVSESMRRRGIARKLLAACEDWARTMGCREFASDCELDNDLSIQFHLKVGFREANRIVCFTRTL